MTCAEKNCFDMRRNRDRGATFVEYAIATGILVLVFIAVRDFLQAAAENRAENTLETANTDGSYQTHIGCGHDQYGIGRKP